MAQTLRIDALCELVLQNNKKVKTRQIQHKASGATKTETVYKLMDERLNGCIITLAGLQNLAAKLDEERIDWSPAFILTGNRQ